MRCARNLYCMDQMCMGARVSLQSSFLSGLPLY